MAKIPSRKFSAAKKKIASRPFSKSQSKIASRGFNKGTAKIVSRGFAKAPAIKKQPTRVDRSAEEKALQGRLSELKALKPASEL